MSSHRFDLTVCGDQDGVMFAGLNAWCNVGKLHNNAKWFMSDYFEMGNNEARLARVRGVVDMNF